MTKRYPISALVILSVLILSVITTLAQFERMGFEHVLYWSYGMAEKVLNGTALAPYQYRLIADILYVWCARLSFPLGVMLFVLATIAWMYASVALYLRALKASPAQICILLSILMWATTSTDNAIMPHSYVEIALYMLAAYAMQTRRDTWILPISVLGVLNRETFIFLPLAFALTRLSERAGIATSGNATSLFRSLRSSSWPGHVSVEFVRRNRLRLSQLIAQLRAAPHRSASHVETPPSPDTRL